MAPKWFIGLATLFIFLTVINGLLEQEYLGSEHVGVLESIMSPDIPSFSNPLAAVGGMFTIAIDWVQALWAMFWFDYDFLKSPGWELVRYGIYWPISFGVIVTLVLSLFRGVGG